jgi:hypothetical protein
MNIAAWSFGRLVGFWCIGIAAELMLLAAPVAYGLVYAWRHDLFARPVSTYTYVEPSAAEAVRIGRRHSVEIPMVEHRRVEIPLVENHRIERLERARSRVELRARSGNPNIEVFESPRARAGTRFRPMRSIEVYGPARSGHAMAALELRPVSSLWIPFAAIYVLTIPIGLIVISLIWIATRGRKPPPASA